jgi:hypothetical protein
MLKAPLLGPPSDKESDWHAYLREAYFRLDADWQEGFPGTTVLRLPEAKDYAASRRWVQEALAEDAYEGRVLMFASPSQENLTAVLQKESKAVGKGKLKGVRIYVAVGDHYWPPIEEALRPTGATLIQIDPANPIAQRPQRLLPSAF